MASIDTVDGEGKSSFGDRCSPPDRLSSPPPAKLAMTSSSSSASSLPFHLHQQQPPTLPSPSNPIAPLDQHSVSLLRSGFHLHSIGHLLQSLIQIAIDSGANSITASLDLRSYFITVDDNGLGIDKRLLSLLGRFDPTPLIRSGTQSHDGLQDIPTHLSLAQHRILDSLAHLSLLDICCRSPNSSNTHQTIFRNGQPIYSGPAKTSRRHNQGTTITVRDLFHNLPVRRVHEASDVRRDQRLKREWDDCRRSLQLAAIVNPNVTFVLRQASVQHTSLDNPHGEFIRISKTGASVLTFGKVFGQQLAQDSIPVNSASDKFHLHGFLGKNRHSSKSAQLIYLDKVLIAKSSLIHKSLCNLFSKLTSQHASSSSSTSSASGLKRPSQYSISPSKSSASLVDYQPVYLLMFESTDHHHRANAISSEMDFVDKADQALAPRVEEQLAKIAASVFAEAFGRSGTTGFKQTAPPAAIFPTSKARVSHSGQQGCPRHGQKAHSDLLLKRPMQGMFAEQAGKRRQRSVPAVTKSTLAPKLVHSHRALNYLSHSRLSQAIKAQRATRSPSSSERRGMLGPNRQPSTVGQSPASSLYSSVTEPQELLNTRRPLKRLYSQRPMIDRTALRTLPTAPGASSSPGWIAKGLADYQNPIFGRQSARVDGLGSEGQRTVSDKQMRRIEYPKLLSRNPYRAGASAGEIITGQPRGCGAGPDCDGGTLESEGMREEINLHKLARGSYRVVGQLDRKFIIVCLGPAKLVVAFDQHAVHERIRVERYLAQMCLGTFEVKTIGSVGHQREGVVADAVEERPVGVQVVVSRVEMEGFRRWQGLFSRWGMVIRTPSSYGQSLASSSSDDDDDDGEMCQITVLAVPELIATRLDRDRGLLERVLRGCLAFFEDSAGVGLSGIEGADGEDWFGKLRACPTVLVDLLNSRACRGAIMFGDILEIKESEQLIEKLGTTKVPFHCAHGRPTCFPVGKMGGGRWNEWAVEERKKKKIDWSGFLGGGGGSGET